MVWTIPSPSSLSLGCSPSSLYTFPFGLGSGLSSALPVKSSPNLGCVRQKFPPEASIESLLLCLIELKAHSGWGPRIRTLTDGVKARRPTVRRNPIIWCREWDLNPQDRGGRGILSPLCLPFHHRGQHLYSNQILPALQPHFFPFTVPVRISHRLHSLVFQEVLAVDAWLCHRGRPVLEEPDDNNLLWNLLELQNQIDFSVHLVKGVAAVLVSASKLGGIATVTIDADLGLIIPSECSQMKETTAFQGEVPRLIVHWTWGPIPPYGSIITQVRALYTN